MFNKKPWGSKKTPKGPIESWTLILMKKVKGRLIKDMDPLICSKIEVLVKNRS